MPPVAFDMFTYVHVHTFCIYILMHKRLCTEVHEGYTYSRGQKKVNISFACNERFRFVSFSFRFRFVSVLTRRILKIDRLRSHFPFFVFRLSVFPCPTENAMGERADRRERHERCLGKATRSPRPWFLAREASACFRGN